MASEDNVRVAVRVRPLLPKEKIAGEQKCVKILKDSNQILVGKDRQFTFDYVITPMEKQDNVYNTCIDELVASCFEGYNATVFAYGQTGSGKTYTIGGTSAVTHTEDEMGIIPRALQRIFTTVEVGKEEGVKFIIYVSYLELYMEELRDLLDSSISSKDITIREDDQGNTIVSGMREVPCETIDEVLYCLQHGSASRQTGSTQMNEHSSRSHSVFTVTIEQQWRDDGEVNSSLSPEQYHYICSKFHFVDLAGSERAHRTGNVGDRFKESITINTGLLALGNVISALGDPKKKSSHIPYRDSKITRLLKDSLGGNAKTLMICCISPAVSDFDETLNALKYANRARNIKNKPIVNKDVQTMRLEEMQNEIQALRKELEIKDSLLRDETNLSSRTSKMEIQPTELQIRDAKVASLQNVCQDLQQLIEEAADMFQTMQEERLLQGNASQTVNIWLDRYQQLRSSGTLPPLPEDYQAMTRMKSEVQKYQEMLKNDEEIFTARTIQVNELQSENRQLANQCQFLSEELERSRAKYQELEDKFLDLKMKYDHREVTIEDIGHHDNNGRRIMSVPPRDRLAINMDRPVHTSPAMFTLERYMQGFRARSQLLVDRLDDEDEVIHQPFPGMEEFDGVKGDNSTSVGLKNTNLKRSGTSDRARGRTLSFGDVMVKHTTIDEGYDMNEIDESMDRHQKEIRQAKLKSQEFNSRLRDLTIAIRMKEQLIRQLVKNEKDSAVLVRQHKEKITQLEEEKGKVSKELEELQKEFQKFEGKDKIEPNSKKKLQGEYKRRIDSAKRRLMNIQNKHKETVKLANMSERTDEKINDLHLAVAKMRQQQDELQKKLKIEQEKKEKLEKDMAKEQHRVRELEDITEQQQKVLKIKTEEAAAATRKLRKGSAGNINGSSNKEIDDPKLQEQKQWLDAEMEKILEQRKQMEQLEKELRSRAMIIDRKEEMMKEKGELELKNLRASQQVAMSKKVLDDLNKERSEIQKQRAVLDKKLYNIGALSPDEDRRLLELSEAIEALDAAIEFKSDIIAGREAELRRSQVLTQHEDNLSNRLKSLNVVEAQKLLSRYFNKVIELRETSQLVERQNQDYEVQMDEQRRVIAEMEAGLDSQRLEFDNRLTEQQQQYEMQINGLLKKITEREPEENQNTQQFIKMQQLEKDLYYYKKTSRDLKKKLREVMLRLGEQAAAGLSADSHIEESHEPLELESNRGHSSPTRYSPTHLPPLTGAMTPSARASYSSNLEGQHVKISKKDLRPMSQEEVLMRRSHLHSAHSHRASTDSLDGH